MGRKRKACRPDWSPHLEDSATRPALVQNWSGAGPQFILFQIVRYRKGTVMSDHVLNTEFDIPYIAKYIEENYPPTEDSFRRRAAKVVQMVNKERTTRIHTYDVAVTIAEIRRNPVAAYTSDEELAAGILNQIEEEERRHELARAKAKQRKNYLTEIRQLLTKKRPVTKWSMDDIYTDFGDTDQKLIEKWGIDTTKQAMWDEARLRSARLAEKVTKRFYENLGHTVSDIASTQLEAGAVDWLTHDLLLQTNDSPLDVKNTRKNNQQRTYPEWQVPQFKLDRKQDDVTVVGVVSPYLNLESMKDPDQISRWWRPCDVRVLGETSRTMIQNLMETFQQRWFRMHYDNDRRVPPWMFEYPADFYKQQAEAVAKFRQMVEDAGMPTWKEFQSQKINPFPLCLLGGIELPEELNAQLSPWRRDLWREMHTSVGQFPTLPVVYLALIRHFLRAITKGELEFDGEAIEGILSFSIDGMDPFSSQGYNEYADRKYLGIADPMDVLDSLVDIFRSLWEHRQTINFASFESFTLYGEGLLRGKRRGQNDRRETIWAYCGGKIVREGRKVAEPCLYSPLIRGLTENCPKCGRLICPECKHCTDDCSAMFQRRAQDRQPANDAPWAHGIDTIEDEEIPF